MNNSKTDALKNSSIEILKAETAALLFNLGKTHVGFWEERIGSVIMSENDFKKICNYDKFTKYKYYYERKYYEEDIKKVSSIQKVDNNDLLQFIENTNINIGGHEIKFIEIMKGDASSNDASSNNDSREKFVGRIFIRGCENINSGIDKGNPNNDQALKKMWLSNAFGSFKEKIDPIYLDESRVNFFKNVLDFLNENDFLNKNKYFTTECWSKIRNYVFEKIKQWYTHLLSDSRYPINDVSLWDQAYMTATMFKSALAAIVLDNEKYETYSENPQEIKWCILGVQYDKKDLCEKALKCSYIQAYRKIIEEIDDRVKNLIEIKYALGNEIYRDETGIYFLVPENIKGRKAETDSSCKFYYVHDDLDQLEEEIYSTFKDKTDSEIFPCILCTEESRGLLMLSGIFESSRDNFLNKKIYSLPKVKKVSNNICQVCGIRTAETFDGDYNVCRVCFDRRESRVENWLENSSKETKETIWTGELQNEKGKIALITLKFDLGLWLNGEMMSGLTINEYAQTNGYECIKYFIENIFCYRIAFSEEIINIIENNINKFDNLKEKLKNDLEERKKYIGVAGECSSELKKLKKALENFNIIDYGMMTLCKEIEKDIYVNSFDKKHLPSQIKNHIKNIRDKLSNLKAIITQDDNLNNLDEILNDIEEKMKRVDKLQSCKNEFIGYKDNFNGIARDAFIGCCSNNETLQDFLKQIFVNPSADKGWITLFNLDKEVINADTGEIKFDKMNDEYYIELFSKLLFQLLITKSPSPARLKRIWDSTQNFMEEVKQNAYELFKLDQEKYRSCRLIFNINSSYPEGIYKYKECDFYCKEGKVFLITSLLKALKFIAVDVDGAKEAINSGENIDKLKLYLKEIIIEKIEGDSKKIKLKPENLSAICTYKPIFTITSPTPVSTQLIIPADKAHDFIEKVQEIYMNHFKWVYGKLPLHIGVVVQDYTMPLYIGIKSLRKMERNLEKAEDIEKTALVLDEDEMKKLFCRIKHFENDCEKSNDIYKFYSLYKTNGDEGFKFFFLNKEARFQLPPNSDSLKSIKYTIYPNTVDFEFIDTNTRINDIYYDNEIYKRYLKLKNNRPYTWEEWKKFKTFKEIFNKNLRTKLNNLISLIYSKLYDWQVLEGENYAEFKKFCAALFYNTLELKKNSKIIPSLYQILDISGKDSTEENFMDTVLKLEDKKFIKNILMFLDMYEFWYKVLKEV